MRNIKCTLAYDGTDYAGWQWQPGAATVQGTLQTALERITGARTAVVASGRTDAGVHALGQVAAFRTDCRLPAAILQKALNANLPADIAVLRLEEAAADFHPIRDCVRKRYRYLLNDGPLGDLFARRYAWHRPGRLDEGRIAAAAAALVGRHDFASFQTAGAPRKSTVRTVFVLDVARRGDVLQFEVEADGFLYNMVRTIVGTLVEIGRGAEAVEWMTAVLTAADRRRAGPTAPALGLFLLRADYPADLHRRAAPPCELPTSLPG